MDAHVFEMWFLATIAINDIDYALKNEREVFMKWKIAQLRFFNPNNPNEKNEIGLRQTHSLVSTERSQASYGILRFDAYDREEWTKSWRPQSK